MKKVSGFVDHAESVYVNNPNKPRVGTLLENPAHAQQAENQSICDSVNTLNAMPSSPIMVKPKKFEMAYEQMTMQWIAHNYFGFQSVHTTQIESLQQDLAQQAQAKLNESK